MRGPTFRKEPTKIFPPLAEKRGKETVGSPWETATAEAAEIMDREPAAHAIPDAPDSFPAASGLRGTGGSDARFAVMARVWLRRSDLRKYPARQLQRISSKTGCRPVPYGWPWSVFRPASMLWSVSAPRARQA